MLYVESGYKMYKTGGWKMSSFVHFLYTLFIPVILAMEEWGQMYNSVNLED